MDDHTGTKDPQLYGDLIGVALDGQSVVLDAVLSNAEVVDRSMAPGSPVTLVFDASPGEGESLEHALRPLVGEGLIWALRPSEGDQPASLLVTAADQEFSVLVTI
jgi:hypothetical protein